MKPNRLKNNRKLLKILTLLCFLSLGLRQASGQTPTEPPPFSLLPAQTIEREITGAQTHRYKFDLKANEFFQVRAEQRGVDVTLKLADANGNVLATMDSPNGNRGFEQLSFVASEAGSFILEVVNSDAKVEKAAYSLRREASRAATAKDKRRVEAEGAFAEGVKAYTANGQGEIALKKFQEALAGWEELKDAEMVSFTAPLVAFAPVKSVLDDAFKSLSKAQAPMREILQNGDINLLNLSKEEALKADDKFRAAGRLAQKIINDHPDYAAKYPGFKNFPYYAKDGEILVAGFLSGYFNYLLEPEESLRYAQLAVSLAKEAGGIETVDIQQDSKVKTEVGNLLSLAQASEKNKSPETISYYEELLSRYGELKKLNSSSYSERQEADLLRIVSAVYSREACRENFLVCLQKAIGHAEKAASIYQRLNEQAELAEIYSFIGQYYYRLNELYKASEYMDKSISIIRASGNKERLAYILIAKASLYLNLGNKEKSNQLQNEALEILLSITKYKDASDAKSLTPFNRDLQMSYEMGRTGIIGGVYLEKDPEKSIEYLKKSAEIAKLLSNKSSEASTLSTIGLAYRYAKDWERALAFYQQASALYQETEDKRREASNLVDIGLVYLELKKPQEALQAITQAQLIFNSLGIEDSGVLNNLARTWYALGNRRLAIFYGKKTVNWIQNERDKLKDFDRATQQVFVNSFEKSIRRLADWLIEEGRFAQAEQVLRILKEEEFSAFVRRDPEEIKSLNQRIELNSIEKRIIEKYNLLTKRVSEIGQEYYKLDEKKQLLSRKKLKLADAELKRHTELEQQLKTANDAFLLFLDKELVKEIGAAKKTGIEDQFSKSGDLEKLGAGTVMLYTVVGEDRYRVILTTPKVQIDGKSEIKAEVLNKKVFEFRAALQNPKLDPRPLGKELYDILIKPIEKDLEAAGAKTLIWSLDGTLRYIPLAALSPDGEKYLIEKYQSVVITSKTNNLDLPKSSAGWQALGLGVSLARTVNDPLIKDLPIPFPSLPGTKTELLSIIRDEESKDEKGVLSGKRFMDTAFTVEAFKEWLKKETANGKRKYNVVHIASHFRLGNNNYNSFLLLGNGQLLTLHDLSGSEIKFNEVDLITLSACNTAFADSNNGVEVDSLAEVIQIQGGKSILATLWSVADESTSLLMSEFYRLRKENPRLTKAEAIQLAQQEMIQGKLQSSSAGNLKGAELAASPNNKVNAPPFQFDKNKPFAHPYYWSPFVLIGNWR
ncbi:MAG TPA: CHAT domain-containing tetratricopeptide repeat protein [Pyrinomonadaceae bacterium]|jgi:CHAT domain-containing protein